MIQSIREAVFTWDILANAGEKITADECVKVQIATEEFDMTTLEGIDKKRQRYIELEGAR